MQKKHRYGAALAAISLLCLGLAASSQGESAGDVNARRQAETVSAAAVGDQAMQSMRVYRDPETGQLGRAPSGTFRLSAEEQNMLSRSTAGLTSRVLPNGAIALDLQGRFMSLSVATRNADGSISMNCFHDSGQAERHLQQQAATGSRDGKEVRDVR